MGTTQSSTDYIIDELRCMKCGEHIAARIRLSMIEHALLKHFRQAHP